MYQWCEFKSRRGKNKNLTALKSNSNTVWFNFQTYIYIKKSNEIHMLVHIKEISKKRTRRIFHNILVLTFSLLFRYNVYKCTLFIENFVNRIVVTSLSVSLHNLLDFYNVFCLCCIVMSLRSVILYNAYTFINVICTLINIVPEQQ